MHEKRQKGGEGEGGLRGTPGSAGGHGMLASYLDCGDGFTDAYLCLSYRIVQLDIGTASYMPIIPQ